MATTPTYNFNLPEVGANDDIWGTLLNTNWTNLDTLLETTYKDEIRALITQLVAPVGTIRISSDNTNPSTYIPNTTWAQVSQGRAIVGVGTADGLAWTAGQERGNQTFQLAIANLPSHTHTVDPPNTTTSGNNRGHTHFADPPGVNTGGGGAHNHGLPLDAIGFGGNNIFGGFVAQGSSLGSFSVGNHVHFINIPGFTTGGESQNHTHTVNIGQFNSGSVGGNTAFSLIQPSKAYYVWERTA